MSQPPPPPYAAPQRPSKPRPKARWWWIGGGLLVLAGVAFVVGLTLTLRSAVGGGEVVDASTGPVQVEVEPGERRALFVEENAFTQCRLADADGAPLEVRTNGLSTTVTSEGVIWEGVGTFTSETAEITVDCSTTGGLARIGEPLGQGFVGGILLTVFVPMAIGLAGFVVLLVTLVLTLTRPAAPRAPR